MRYIYLRRISRNIIIRETEHVMRIHVSSHTHTHTKVRIPSQQPISEQQALDAWVMAYLSPFPVHPSTEDRFVPCDTSSQNFIFFCL